MPPIEETEPTTPVVEANTPEGTGEPQVDWQEKYKNLESDHTRAAQEAAELRARVQAIETDDDEFKRLAALRGYEFDEPEADDLDADELAQLRKEFGDFKAQVETSTTQAEEARETARIDTEIDQTFKRLGLDGDEFEEERQAAFGAALTMPFVNGVPPVDEGWKHIEGLFTKKQRTWATTKRPSHRVSPNGAAGTETPDLRTQAGRLARARQLAAELDD